MNQRFRVSGQVVGRLEELAIPADAVLRHAGLPAELFQQPKILVTTEELFALWRGIGAVSQDPAIGLKLGSDDRAERYDPIGIAALCTRTFGEALERMARYKQLTCPEEIRIDNGPEECTVEFRWLLAREMVPEILIDLCFSWVLAVGRRGTGTHFSPARLELVRERSHPALLERHFGCPVIFEAGRNALVFRAADTGRTFVTRNPELLAIVAPKLEEELYQQHARESFPERVRAVIKRRLAGQRPSVDDIARELRMSSRTLQRRLQESEYSFQQVLGEARRELARHYLRHSPLEMNETAYLLGYEDANSFVRAFHGWEGVPPAHWREAERLKTVQ